MFLPHAIITSQDRAHLWRLGLLVLIVGVDGGTYRRIEVLDAVRIAIELATHRLVAEGLVL